MTKIFYILRRKLLKFIVPDFFFPVYVSVDGAMIKLRGSPYSLGVKRVLLNGSYEKSERILIRKVLLEGNNVIEFGGSIGIIAAIAKEIVKDSGIIVSVEAASEIVNYSKTWLEPKGNIFIECGLGFPVSKVPGNYTNLSFEFDGNTLGGKVNFAKKSTNSKHDYYWDLNKIQSKYNFLCDVLIVDIEGSEIVFLEPEVSIPSNVKHIIIELHPILYGFKTESDILKKIISFGFNCVEEISHVYLLSKSE